VGGTLFFVAGFYSELWKSNGTAAGTVLVKKMAGTFNLTSIGGTLYFVADDGAHGSELWKSDGTPAGTVLVKDINPSGSSTL
jgi:ELWxxDGT repeat protein